MTHGNATVWRTAFEDLLSTLRAAQAERPQRQDIINGLPGWVRHEHEVMTDRVNLLRSRRALPPVSMDDVRAKESMAAGHVDYTKKYALGCADLVVPRVTKSAEEQPR